MWPAEGRHSSAASARQMPSVFLRVEGWRGVRRGWQLQSIWPRINGFLIGCSLVAEKPWGPSLEAGVIAAEGQVSHTLLTLASSRLLLSDKCFVPNSKNPASLGPSRGTVVIRHKLTLCTRTGGISQYSIISFLGKIKPLFQFCFVTIYL